MGRGQFQPRKVRSGKGDESDEEGAAGLAEDGGVVNCGEDHALLVEAFP